MGILVSLGIYTLYFLQLTHPAFLYEVKKQDHENSLNLLISGDAEYLI